MLNTRNPCPAQDPYNNSNVREIRFWPMAKASPKYHAQKN